MSRFLWRLSPQPLIPSALAALLGLGDVAAVSPLATVVLNGVRILLPLVIVAAVCNALRARRWPRFPKSLAAPSAVWLAVLVVSALMSPTNQHDALASLSRPASGLLLVWATCQMCRTRRHWQRVTRALALGGLAIALVAVAEAASAPPIDAMLATLHDGAVPIGDVPRAAATLSHPNVAAMLLELALPLLVAWAWTAAPRWRPWLAVAASCTLLAIGLTFSRAGLVAALVAVCVLAIACVRRLLRPRLLTLGIVALALPLAVGWGLTMDPGLNHRLLAGLDEASAEQPSRLTFWSTAVDMARDYPLTGVGPDNFRWRFSEYSGVAEDNLGIHAHDQYLESLADTGVLGFAAFLWLTLSLVRLAVRRVRRAPREDQIWRAALLASLVAWLTHAAVDDFERFWPTSVAFWLIVGLTVCRPSRPAVRLPIEEPESPGDQRDDDQHNEDAGRTAERRTAAAAAKTDHDF